MSVLEQWYDEKTVPGRAVGWLLQWYHVFVVAGLFGFMFWLRARTWNSFIVDGDVLFRGNDPWYHLREVSYTVANWPNTLPMDPWTAFPYGVFNSQFGTLYDQLMATIAVILGLGNPSDQLIRLVVLFAPAVLGAAVVIPTYYLGKQVGDRIGGVIAALLVALSAGELFSRSLVGFSDHHVAEVFFQAVAVLAILIALRVAQDEKPIFEHFEERDWNALRRPLGWGAIAGVAVALYMAVWPPGILLVGILGVYVTLQLPIAVLRGESPEHMSIVAGIIFLIAGVMTLASIDSVGVGMVETSLAQPGLAVAGTVWVGVLSWVAREWDRRDLETWQYPAVVFSSLFTGALLVMLVLPDLFWYFINQLLRFVGFTVNPTAAANTIAEVQPLPFSQAETLITWLGVMPLVAAIGVVLALVHQYTTDELDPAYLFVALWFVFFVAATFTQRRFAYYLTVPAVTVTALVVARLFRYLRSIRINDEIDAYELLVVANVILALLVPMVLVSPTVLDRSTANGPGSVTGWQSSLDYMETETPGVGNFGGAGNDDQLAFYGTYERTDDFEYPDGAYGVMSWWDYGHWITQEGERIPVANPFQRNAGEAASFLMAQSESQAESALDAVSESPDATTRYVMVDWKMATAHGGYEGLRWGKFFAPSAFLSDVDRSTFYRGVRGVTQTERGLSPLGQYFTVQKQAYYETMSARLYRYHGSAASPTDVPGIGSLERVPVVDWDTVSGEQPDGSTVTYDTVAMTQNGTGQTIKFFENRSAAEAFVEEDGTAQIGGLGSVPSEPVPALQHYRLAQVSEQQYNGFMASQPGLFYLLRNGQPTGLSQQSLGLIQEPNPAWTKVFERVPGATVEGEGPANTAVTASVEMEMPNANSTFTYRQHAETGADGEFTMTLPYSTTGYENWGPEDGFTNVSVRANGSYEFSTEPNVRTTDGTRQLVVYNDTADVTEGQVIGTNETVVDVELARTVQAEQELSTGNESTDNGTADSESSESLVPVDVPTDAASVGAGVTDGAGTSIPSLSIGDPTARPVLAGQ